MLYRENPLPDGVSYGILLDVLCAKHRYATNAETIYTRELKQDLIILDNLTRKSIEKQREQFRSLHRGIS